MNREPIFEQDYAMSSEPPDTLQCAIKVDPTTPCPIFSVSLCSHGKLIACGLSNKSALIFTYPDGLPRSALATSHFNTMQPSSTAPSCVPPSGAPSGAPSCAPAPKCKPPIVLNGHNNAVREVHFSNNRDWVITSSLDASAGVWRVLDGALLLRVDRISRSFGGTGSSGGQTVTGQSGGQTLTGQSGGQNITGKSGQSAATFKGHVRFAQFFYLDEFFLLASGNSFFLYNFTIDSSKDDVKRFPFHLFFISLVFY